MNRTITYCLYLCILATASITQVQATSQKSFIQSYSGSSSIKDKHISIMYKAEKNSSPAGQLVLRQARKSALDQRKIVKGSCWDYLNYVFNKAGFPNNGRNRQLIFKGKLRSGPYINTNRIQSGDWLYYINHSYHDIEHSGMFVGWVDKSKNIALMYSYAGQSKRSPARYKTYDISHVYNVMRPSFGKKKPKKTSVKSKKISTKPVRKVITTKINTNREFVQKYRQKSKLSNQYLSIIHDAEKNTSNAPLKILRRARYMTLDTKKVIAGSSQNYIKVLFNNAGVRYKNFFVGNRSQDNFINPYNVKSGDWLSFINHDYNESEHSGIFIGWINQSRNKALILSYGGEGRKDPARYRPYDISHVHHVRRAIL